LLFKEGYHIVHRQPVVTFSVIIRFKSRRSASIWIWKRQESGWSILTVLAVSSQEEAGKRRREEFYTQLNHW